MYDKSEVTRIVKEKAKKILTKKIQVGDSSVGNVKTLILVGSV